MQSACCISKMYARSIENYAVPWNLNRDLESVLSFNYEVLSSVCKICKEKLKVCNYA